MARRKKWERKVDIKKCELKMRVTETINKRQRENWRKWKRKTWVNKKNGRKKEREWKLERREKEWGREREREI